MRGRIEPADWRDRAAQRALGGRPGQLLRRLVGLGLLFILGAMVSGMGVMLLESWRPWVIGNRAVAVLAGAAMFSVGGAAAIRLARLLSR